MLSNRWSYNSIRKVRVSKLEVNLDGQARRQLLEPVNTMMEPSQKSVILWADQADSYVEIALWSRRALHAAPEEIHRFDRRRAFGPRPQNRDPLGINRAAGDDGMLRHGREILRARQK